MTTDPTPEERDRLARRILGGGVEPDPRFTLANERTFLAWIRTSLALLAGGVGIEAFTKHIFPSGWHKVLAVALIALAMCLSATACWRWLRIERAMRQHRPLPLSIPAIVLAGGVAAVSTAIAVVFIVRGS